MGEPTEWAIAVTKPLSRAPRAQSLLPTQILGLTPPGFTPAPAPRAAQPLPQVVRTSQLGSLL